MNIKRVSDKYYIYLRGTFKEVSGARPVVLPGFEDFDCFATREGETWSISDAVSGTLVLAGIPHKSLKDTALRTSEQLREYLMNRKLSKDYLFVIREANIEKYGLSPRYDLEKE